MDPSVNWAKNMAKRRFPDESEPLAAYAGKSGRLWTGTRRPSSAIKQLNVAEYTSIPLSTMDIIHQCLSVVPVPYLAPAFAAFRFIWSSVEQAQASKQQLKALTQSVAQLLQTLHDQYRTGRLLETKTSKPLADLCGFVVLMSSVLELGTYRSCHADCWTKFYPSFRRKPPEDF